MNLFINKVRVNEGEVKGMNRKKKKGFTLVELIAVIAILAILAAVIVPRVGNFTTSANNARDKANANTVLNAIEIYNAQVGADEQLGAGSTTTANQDPTISVIKSGTGLTLNASKKVELIATITKLPSNSGILSKKITEVQALVSATQ